MKKEKLYLFLLIFLLFNTAFYLKFNICADPQNTNKKIKPILSDVTVGNYTVPGISVPIPLDQVIKIGILDDMNYITGESAWNGAKLAAKEINQAGGILLNGTIHYVGLVAENTDEANPNLEIIDGILAAEKIVSYNPHYVIGGFLKESMQAYQEIIMDAKIPFLCTGCPSDSFCVNVYNFYTRYKYFFRASPINETSLAVELISYLAFLTSFLKAFYGQDAARIGILRENLDWTSPIANLLISYLPLLIPNYTLVQEIAYPNTATPVDFVTYLNSFIAANAQIVIPLISGPTGAYLGGIYGQIQPEYLLCGINLIAQSDIYWDLTAGGGRYEITMQPIHNTNKTDLTIPFWDTFLAEYDKEPIYTGVGAYDAVRMLAYATNEVQSFNADIIVSELEKINQSNPFPGVSGNIAFTANHDLIEGWPYATDLFCQWQMDGNKVVLSSGNLIYPDSIVTGTLSIPYWGIYNLVDDYSHTLPGGFSIFGDADGPDPDGAFIINWTESEGADYYTVYLSNSPISYVSKNHILITNVTVPGETPISGLRTGNYFIAAVAYNGTGQKFSNNYQVTVQLPAPGNFTLSSDADSPDIDGAFNLIWTDSEGANNYSLYMFDKDITEINESLTLLANQTAISPFPISGLSEGEYYFAVVAYNNTGETMSNTEYVLVQFLPPGDFDLSSDADTPDTDGAFDLIWTSSEGADNYSLYMFDKMITEINSSLTLLANQTATSPFPISGLVNGEYYFAILAHNEHGATMSDNEYVIVFIPDSNGDKTVIIIPGYSFILILCIGFILVFLLIKKSYQKIK